MKYFYNNCKFTREDKVKGCQSPLTYFIETPILSFAKSAKIRIGTIDLCKSVEYDMPIQIGSIILRDILLFTEEEVKFLEHYGTYRFLKANLQYIIIDSRYNPFKYILKDVEFEYIRTENLEFFLNEVIPLLNWGISYHKDIDLILLFTLLLCKKELMADKNLLNLKCPFMSNNFLKELTVKQSCDFFSRVGRDDHAHENTSLIFSAENIKIEEFYCIKLIAKELAEDNFTPRISVKKDEDNFEISYCSMFDNNAYREQSREYKEEECNRYKKMLIDEYDKFYNVFWHRFDALLEQYDSSKSKRLNNWDIISDYDPV